MSSISLMPRRSALVLEVRRSSRLKVEAVWSFILVREEPIFFISSFPLASGLFGGVSSRISSMDDSFRGSCKSTNSGGSGGGTSGFFGIAGTGRSASLKGEECTAGELSPIS